MRTQLKFLLKQALGSKAVLFTSAIPTYPLAIDNVISKAMSSASKVLSVVELSHSPAFR